MHSTKAGPMRATVALLATMLIFCSISTVGAAAGSDGDSATADLLQRRPPPPQRRRALPRPPPPPPVRRPRSPVRAGGSADLARPPPPQPEPSALVPVRLSGYVDRQQAVVAARVLSSLVRDCCAANKLPQSHGWLCLAETS